MLRKRISKTAWSRAAERASLTPRLPLAEGIANYRRLNDVSLQMELAREIAETRGSELTLAFHNVVMVGYGYKRKSGRAGREQLRNIPCVIFFVRRKWKGAASERNRLQRLPSHLFVYATVAGRREICAVPTDVQKEARFHKVTVHSMAGLYAEDDPYFEYGSAMCAVRLESNGVARIYLMSCRHVLSPRMEVGKPGVAASASLSRIVSSDPDQPGPSIGRSAKLGGAVYRDGTPSFDVQLAQMDDLQWMPAALSELKLSAVRPFLASRQALDAVTATHNLLILVPKNHPNWLNRQRPPVVARVSSYMPASFPLTYDVRVNGQETTTEVYHWQLVELQPLGSGRTERGDSGSPVVVTSPDGGYTLVGMHMAGDEGTGFAYMIPAWQLFDVVNYWKLPAGSSLRPVNP